MRKYRTFSDALFGAVLLPLAFATVLVAAASLLYAYAFWEYLTLGVLIGVAAQYLVLTAMIFVVRRQVLAGHVPTWSYAVFFANLLMGLMIALDWFHDPMHDIALMFGSHGRWGCRDLNPDGSPVYFIRDTTVPWMIFGPPIVMTVFHWRRARRRMKIAARKLKNPSVAEPATDRERD